MENDWADLRLLMITWKVLQHKSVREAAEELNTSPSNISAASKKFYEQSGIRLYFLSKDNRIHRTKEGVAFLAMVDSVFAARDEFIAALKAVHKGDIRVLRFGCGTFVPPDTFRAACEIHKSYLPECAIRPRPADAAQLVSELVAGEIDAALLTLPVNAGELRVEEIQRDRLVVCLRVDDPLAKTPTIRSVDLFERLTVIYDPERHPAAHVRLRELLEEAGVPIRDPVIASHPFEMQQLVLDGYGLALVREGMKLDKELTTRPVFGVTWTVDTAVVYHRERHPKTIPTLIRALKRRRAAQTQGQVEKVVAATPKAPAQRPIKPSEKAAEQLSLLDDLAAERLSA
jgi:DNA-binding transcriptional LysR family regulator